MKRLLQDRYVDDNLERAMFERPRRRAETSLPIGSVFFLGLLVLAALAQFAG